MTVEQWCETWVEGYGAHRPSTVRQAKVHIRRIVMEFGPYSLGSLRPSQIRSWIVYVATTEQVRELYDLFS